MAKVQLMEAGWRLHRAQSWRGGSWQLRDECVADESPVALVYNDEPHVVMMATPLNLDDLGLGFSLSEGIIADRSELQACELQVLERGLQLSMRIPAQRHALLKARPRGLEGRSGCGLCGARHIDDVLRPLPRVTAGTVVSPNAVSRAMRELSSLQRLNADTGAVHAAAWASCEGELHLIREDVGRHNALDKLLGALAGAAVPAHQGFVILTSRASSEMVMKVASAGITLVAAVSAPTCLAVEMADEAGITLVGFAREDRCTVYTRAARVSTEH